MPLASIPTISEDGKVTVVTRRSKLLILPRPVCGLAERVHRSAVEPGQVPWRQVTTGHWRMRALPRALILPRIALAERPAAGSAQAEGGCGEAGPRDPARGAQIPAAERFDPDGKQDGRLGHAHTRSTNTAMP